MTATTGFPGPVTAAKARPPEAAVGRSTVRTDEPGGGIDFVNDRALRDGPPQQFDALCAGTIGRATTDDFEPPLLSRRCDRAEGRRHAGHDG